MSVGAVNIRLGAIVSGFLSGMSQASTATNKLTFDINSKLVDSYKRADQAQKVFKGGITRLGSDMRSLGQSVSMFGTLPALFAAGKAYKDFADIERLEMGLKNYGNTLAEVAELAKRPNIGLESASKALLGLRAVGVESDLAKRSVLAFANALTLAGGTAADLQPSLYNLTQILSTGKVPADEIKELAGRVPQIRAALVNAFGTSDSEELKKLGIDSKQFVAGLISELEKLPQMAGGAQNAMDTFADSVKIASATVGDSLDKSLNITGKLNSLGETIQKAATGFSKMSAGAQRAITVLGGIAIAAGPVLLVVGQIIAIAPTLGAALSAGFSAALGPIGLLTAALAGVLIYQDEINAGFTEGIIASNKFIAGLADAVGLDSYAKRLRGLAAENQIYLDSLNGVKYDPAKGRSMFELPGEIRKDSASQRYPFPTAEGVTIKAPKAAAAATPAIAKTTEEVEKLSAAEMKLQSIDLAGKYYRERDAVKSATEEYKKLVGVVAGLDVAKMTGVKQASPEADKLGALRGRADGIAGFTLPQGLTDQLAAEKDRVIQFNEELKSSFTSFYGNISTGFGEMIGGVIAGTSGLQQLPQMIGGLFGQMLKDIGKSFVATAIAAQKFRVALLANPALAIAAGVGMIAVGAALQATVQKNKTPAFAKGGFAYGEMTATVGDNPNARTDPEMIAPYSKVDKSIQQSVMKHGMSNGFVVEIVGQLDGEMIRLQQQRVTKRKALIGG